MPYYPPDIEGLKEALDHYRKLYTNTLGKDYQAFGYSIIDTMKYQTYLLEQIQIIERFIFNEDK